MLVTGAPGSCLLNTVIISNCFQTPDGAKAIPITQDSKVYGANMGPIWGRQDSGGPHVGPTNLAIGAITPYTLKMGD